MTEREIPLERKLKILADAAKYDVACTSSGSSRRGKKGHLGNTVSVDICHTFSSDGRCVSLLKILFSNDCVFDCKYCPSRAANEKERATFTPEEICRLVVEFYRRNYIEGLFLSSAVVKSPAYTMERMYEAIYMLRNKYHFNGYIHVKAIPGAPDDIIYALGFLVDRMSVNLELPTAEGLKRLAPNKKPKNLIRPIQQIQRGIQTQRVALGKDRRMERAKGNQYLSNSIFNEKNTSSVEEKSVFSIMEDAQKSVKKNDNVNRRQNDPELPAIGTAPPLLREHRLYQADWLLRYYGFQADELLSSDRPNFNTFIDPKCDWALRHLEYFPVEINQASYEQLLRVPGIGNKSAGRIVRARRQAALDFEDIKKMGVVLKRAVYFITCRGKMKYHTPIEEDFITRQLIGTNQKDNWKIEHPTTYRQLSLFDDFNLT
ncbi:putative DNA modification/repair radical SAM protein [Anaerobutyricum hallii]|uniref:Putative DNA modification/repair radical SAM protein n=1 Tax=Anaerobutyricum hallii DSM 3353 TaxID=411469 RepID=C0EZQ3_9FIRM|nr:putative DNA modification/repair radical SAM protein [Anaerobutyricum hallii]EEG35230.1 putative DNA modification/repair radical SAM protein [Anaerobutyricum hallii DSM 3353]QUF80706.1 putative DNA modification/repair radical SAM protein [Anaerobutyricum hallii]